MTASEGEESTTEVGDGLNSSDALSKLGQGGIGPVEVGLSKDSPDGQSDPSGDQDELSDAGGGSLVGGSRGTFFGVLTWVGHRRSLVTGCF